MTRFIIVALAAALAAAACSGSPGGKPGTGAGGGAGEGGSGGSGARVCTTCSEDGSEDCLGCWTNLLECCYAPEDRTGASAQEMASRCFAYNPCRICCNECAALSCEEHKAAGNCPNL